MPEYVLLHLAIALAAAKVGGEICDRWLKQPAVLGELLCGVLVGTSVLNWVPGSDQTLGALAEIGAVLLLFEVGMASDLGELFQVGLSALWVAAAGVALPFVGGYLAAEWLGCSTIEAVFVGAALTATSVGITARVFSDLHLLDTREARVVLGAAVADDVIGLVILAVLSGLAVTQTVTVSGVLRVSAVAVAFLVGAIAIGSWVTPLILGVAHRMRTRAALSSAAVILCLLVSSVASLAQLAPIVGAFAAGLVLAKAEHRVHFEEKLKAVADLFVPVFFVMMGARMDLSMLSPATAAGRHGLSIGVVLLLVAVVGKVVAGLTVPDRGVRRLTVGLGMIPRGEVGLIFAGMGMKMAVIPSSLYAAIVFVVVGTTFLTPPLLKACAGGAVRRARDLPSAA
jgi:Kef-type K+ transport system membrane component KefB